MAIRIPNRLPLCTPPRKHIGAQIRSIERQSQIFGQRAAWRGRLNTPRGNLCWLSIVIVPLATDDTTTPRRGGCHAIRDFRYAVIGYRRAWNRVLPHEVEGIV